MSANADDFSNKHDDVNVFYLEKIFDLNALLLMHSFLHYVYWCNWISAILPYEMNINVKN